MPVLTYSPIYAVLDSIQAGDILVFNAITGRWENKSGGGPEADYAKIIFGNQVNGDNTNDGRTRHKSVKDIPTAITLASALTPSESNQIKIRIEDGATYTLSANTTLPAWVHIHAPNATLDCNGFSFIMATGANQNSIHFDRIQGSGVGVDVIDKLGSGVATVTARIIKTLDLNAAISVPTGSMDIRVDQFDCEGFPIVATTNAVVNLAVDSMILKTAATAGIFYAGAGLAINGYIKNLFSSTAGAEGINVLGGIASLKVDNLNLPSGTALRVTAGRLNLELSNSYTGAVVFGGVINIKGTPKNQARYYTTGNTADTTITGAGVFADVNRNVTVNLGTLVNFTHLGDGEFRFDGDYPMLFQVFMKALKEHITNPAYRATAAVLINDAFSAAYPYVEDEENTQTTSNSSADMSTQIALSPLDTIKLNCTTSNGDDLRIANENLQLMELQPI